MKLNVIWIVRNPTNLSTLPDILWQITLTDVGGSTRLDNVIKGSNRDAMITEGWTFYTELEEARLDAQERLTAYKKAHEHLT